METNTRRRVLNDVLVIIRRLAPVVRRIRKQSRSLGDQIERSASSIALNLSEGNAVQDGNRRARFKSALGSTQETRTALKVAAAWGYVDDTLAARFDSALDSVAARIYCLANR